MAENPKSRTISLTLNIDNSSNLMPLNNTIATPVHVDPDALHGHPDPSFILKLCTNFWFGAPCMFKFSKKLKSVIDNLDIVSNNLAKEVTFGHAAGPFTNPPFAKLQVLPIGIIPKKHSDNCPRFPSFLP